MHTILICPVCDSALERQDKRYVCINHHSFDLAREGYVNLLLANQKASKMPGDSLEMLQARRRFLESGSYKTLSDYLNQIVAQHLYANDNQTDVNKPITILEAGCGEGYYLGKMQQFLKENQPSTVMHYWGLDISKDAIRMASRRYKEINFLVASTRRKITIADQGIHVLLTIFAPRNPIEYRRIVAIDGIVIVVIPDINHLRQLREILGMPERLVVKQDEVIVDFQDGFELNQVEKISSSIELNNESLLDLVKMTPNYWHISPNVWASLHQIECFETEIEFLILGFRRKHSES